jgi:ABC-type antimicrobial peptide transport system, ATPase component
MIQLKNLERSYKTPAGQTWVLRRINLEIRSGEFITIMGPSGAGKSSLLNVLALLDDAWEGEYWFRDEAVHAMKRKQRGDWPSAISGWYSRAIIFSTILRCRKILISRSRTKTFPGASARA